MNKNTAFLLSAIIILLAAFVLFFWSQNQGQPVQNQETQIVATPTSAPREATPTPSPEEDESDIEVEVEDTLDTATPSPTAAP